MEWKKAKWLIIAVLLAVNVFLAFNIIVKYSQAQKASRGELLDALSLTRELPGFSEETFSSLPVYIYSFTSRRSVSTEQALAQSLLSSPVTPSEAGGGVTIYQSGEYRVTFRRGGYTEGFIAAKGGDLKNLSSVLKRAGIKNTVTDDGVAFSYKGKEILNASLTAKSDGAVFSFSGTVPMSDGWTRSVRSLSRGELILALARHVKENGLGKLLSVTVSYRVTPTGVQDISLIPIMTVECENGGLIMSMTDKTLIYSGN